MDLYKITDTNETRIINFYLYISAALIMFLFTYYSGNIVDMTTLVFYNIFILSSVFLAALSDINSNSKSSKLFLIAACFLIFFVFGFRNFTAIDDPSYIRIFNNVKFYGWFSNFKTSTMEPGYLFINDIVGKLTDDYFYMQIVNAVIPISLLYTLLNKLKDRINISMSIFLFLTLIYFQMLAVGLLRMFIAIMIVLHAYLYLVNKKYKKYVLCIILAALFHYSALFLLILLYYFITKNNKSKTFISISFFSIPVLFWVIVKFIVPFLGKRYAQYANIGVFQFNISSFDTVPLLFVLIYFHKKIEENFVNYFEVFISIFSLSFILSFYSSMVSLGRLIFYANTSLVILAPLIHRSLEDRKYKIIFSGIIIFYGFLYLYVTQLTLDTHIPFLFPYENIFMR